MSVLQYVVVLNRSYEDFACFDAVFLMNGVDLKNLWVKLHY